MKLEIQGRTVETSDQGFLVNLDDWSEDVARALAERDGIELFVDHWELIWYFRDYFAEYQHNPSMHDIVLTLGKQKGEHFHHRKQYEKHIYRLFPTDPVHELCKLSGLPMPPPDT